MSAGTTDETKKSQILAALEDQDTTVVMDDPLENEMVLNMGPQHPATHGERIHILETGVTEGASTSA